MSIIHSEVIRDKIELRKSFDENQPFKHVEIPKFFDDDLVERMLDQFPVPKAEEMINEFGHRNNKYACHDVRSIGPAYREIDDYIKSTEFALLMRDLTGIEDLLYDPEYHGSGTHDNMSGQGMNPHVDFNLHRTTGYHRRINAIIYLNEEWEEEWGGCIQVHKNPWDAENDWTKTYLPLKNRCVLFETNEYSWHGFEKVTHPTNPNISRKSFTIYMYTKQRPLEEIGDKHGTIYVPRPLNNSVKPDQVLSAEDYEDTKALIDGRDSMIKGMYEREMKQNNIIKGLFAFRDNIRLPMEGYVRQIDGAIGVHGNFGLNKRLTFRVQPSQDVSWMSVKLSIPEYIKDQKVSININRVNVEEAFEKDNKIDAKIEVNMKAKEIVDIEFVFDKSMSPKEAGVSPDKREFSSNLRNIVFS
jgi:hypothetical protein